MSSIRVRCWPTCRPSRGRYAAWLSLLRSGLWPRCCSAGVTAGIHVTVPLAPGLPARPMVAGPRPGAQDTGASVSCDRRRPRDRRRRRRSVTDTWTSMGQETTELDRVKARLERFGTTRDYSWPAQMPSCCIACRPSRRQRSPTPCGDGRAGQRGVGRGRKPAARRRRCWCGCWALMSRAKATRPLRARGRRKPRPPGAHRGDPVVSAGAQPRRTGGAAGAEGIEVISHTVTRSGRARRGETAQRERQHRHPTWCPGRRRCAASRAVPNGWRGFAR